MNELQHKLLSALLDNQEFDNEIPTEGNWLLVGDRTLGISEKYHGSCHPCYAPIQDSLISYGIVKLFVRSASRAEVSPPEYLHHGAHPKEHACSIKLNGVVSVSRPAKIGAANLFKFELICIESDLTWKRHFDSCLKRMS